MVKKFFFGTFGLILNIAFYALVLLLALRLVTYVYDFSYTVFGDTVMATQSDETVTIQISEGESTDEIATLLEKKGLIKYKYAFIIHVALSQYKGMIRAGEYELSPTMTMDNMLAVMSGVPQTSSE